jgi:hypothetical protein
MAGGLLQLVAYGAQDIYLTGNPQITFFKVVYRRHTNFALEAIENVFNGQARFGSRVTCQISRNGDLIHRTYLAVQLPALKAGGVDDGANTGFKWVRSVGLKLIQDVWIEIGGQQIDKHYSDWMYIWNELSLPAGKRSGYDAMVGNGYGDSATLPGSGLNCNSNSQWLHVPLEFWFCRNVGLALPLIALQYHEVKINIDFETFSNCTVEANTATSGIELKAASLWVDYVYLDTDERRRFAQLSHEYLIEQLQFTGDEVVNGQSGRIKMNFNHPVKEIVWVYPMDSNNASGGGASNNWTNYTLSVCENGNTDSNVLVSGNIQLNGQDRFFTRYADYFSLVQPYQHHENVPTQTPGINVYSFALKPEEHQPSGSLNFSRIDTAYLNMTLKSAAKGRCKIFAVNYNVLRIMSGMGGLAYSN